MFRTLAACVSALLCSAALAGAAPILDGIVSKAEYAVTADDTYVYNAPDETQMEYHDTGLDIDYLGFEIESTYINLGVATKDQYWPGGSPGSMFGQTAVAIAFYTSPPDPQATPPSEALWYLNLATDADGDFTQAMLVQNPVSGDTVSMYLLDGFVSVGAVKSVDPSITAKFAGKVGPDGAGKGLEVWLDPTLFTAVDPAAAPYFTMQLDDLGAWPDDQAVGLIPEPGSAALLLLGAGWLARRRRARA